MQNNKSTIAYLFLIGYIIAMTATALPAEGWSMLTSGKVAKVCKKTTNIIEQNQNVPFRMFASSENETAPIPQAELLFFCGSSTLYIPSYFTEDGSIILQEEDSFASFKHSLYNLIFQEFDPEPPKASYS